tara:strand:+ start:3723 stop:4247 length:525 start_codon:yes stop_codon:yes gene_type:complete
MLTIFQITTAILLFFLINLIGKFAPTELRYFQISSFLETDEVLHENFNRPKLFRLMEYIGSLFKKEGTYGIMQVKSSQVLNDRESVKLGMNIMSESFKKYKLEFEIELEHKGNEEEEESYYNGAEYLDHKFQSKLIRDYNHCDEYSYEIIELADYLNEKFYEKHRDKLNLFGSL